MDVLLQLSVLALCVLASGLYSGSEIGFYSLSRVQVELEAREGRRTSRIVRRLLRDDSALLITILIGNNLAIELATHFGGGLLPGGHDASPVLVTLVLSPILLIFGEALPKDVFRRRPHALIGLGATFVLVSRIVFWPLERLLWLLSYGLERALGLRHGGVAQVRGKETLRTYIEAGKRSGALHERAATLAHNALRLRSIPVERAMVPWSEVVLLARDEEPGQLFAKVRDARFSRLPVVEEGGRLAGYVHQLEVLRAGPGVPVLDALRPIPVLEPRTPIDRALLTLRGSGQRAAVVGSAEQPVGWLTLKDLVEEISGDLAGL